MSNENKDLKLTLEEINTKVYLLNEENKDYSKRLNYFLDNKFDPKLYDDLVREQFENMKQGFLNQLKIIKEETTFKLSENKKNILVLESELYKYKNSNNLLLQREQTIKSLLKL